MNIEAESYIPSFMLQRVADVNKKTSNSTKEREQKQEMLKVHNTNTNETACIAQANSKTEPVCTNSKSKVKKLKPKRNGKRGSAKRVRYSKAELLALQQSPAIDNLIRHDIMVQIDPYGMLPLRFARLLDSSIALEYLNVEGIQQAVAFSSTRDYSKMEREHKWNNDTKTKVESSHQSHFEPSLLSVTTKPASSVEEELLPLLLSIQTTHKKENVSENVKQYLNEQDQRELREVETSSSSLPPPPPPPFVSSQERCLVMPANNNPPTNIEEVFQRLCNNYLVSSSPTESCFFSESTSASPLTTNVKQQELIQALRNYKCSECGPHSTTPESNVVINHKNAFSSSCAIGNNVNNERANNVHEISSNQPVGCYAMHRLMHCIHKEIVSTRAGRCMMQGGQVVWGMLQLALVFEHKQSSIRMRQLAEKSPVIVCTIGEFVFGTGYHMPLPAITEHEAWGELLHLLCFDAVRDNRTRVVTDLSRHWRRRTTAFEQFVYFFAFRDDRPRSRVRNIITRSVKPGMVAMLSGDMVAMTLLHYLGFYTPHDYYWEVYPFLQQALGHSAAQHDVIRHLGHYLSSRQDKNLYNPLGLPFVDESVKQ